MADGIFDGALDFIGDGVQDAVDYVWGEDEDELVAVDDGAGSDVIGDLFGGIIGGDSLAPGAGQLGDIAAAGGPITPYLPAGAVSTATQLVNALLANTPTAAAARELLSRATGWVFDRGPQYQGGAMSVAMAEMMMAGLSDAQVKALAWRAAGADSPAPNATKVERDAFTILFLYDAMKALNATDLATVIMDQTPRRKRR